MHQNLIFQEILEVNEMGAYNNTAQSFWYYFRTWAISFKMAFPFKKT